MPHLLALLGYAALAVLVTWPTLPSFFTRITGENAWRYRGSKPNMYQVEHDEMFAGIRSGNPINNGMSAARSTLLAIMGRMAAYTGEVITWERALNSKEDLSPAQYAWGDAPRRVIADKPFKK